MTTRIAIQMDSTSAEPDLIQRARSDPNAFSELYRKYVNRVYRYHLAHCGNPKDAEDLTSQTFIAALEGLRSFRGAGSFAAWLLGIASRKRLMFFRKRGQWREVELDAASQLPSPGMSIDQLTQLRLQMDLIARALRQIHTDRAEAVSLAYFGGLAIAEISHLMNRTEAAVKMLISRGLQDLRERTSLALEAEDEQ